VSRLTLSRNQVLAYRRTVQALDERLPSGPDALRQAAWAGLQDSMPRAALLSIHARMQGATPSSWEDPSLVQVWGPRFSTYVVPAQDVALFTLGRWPADARGQRVAEEVAAGMRKVLGNRRMRDRDVADAMGGIGNRVRYAATTGTILIRWEGALAPTVWSVPAPNMDPMDARVELARRCLHVFGPTTPESFAEWAGIGTAQGRAAFDALGGSLTPVRTPIGDAWVLTADEPVLRARRGAAAAARLLPSGDTFYLLHGSDRELLVPKADRRLALWTSRVWPGAVLLRGEVAGTWRRAGATVAIEAWRRMEPAERIAIEAEADSLPLPGLAGRISVRWAEGHASLAEPTW
jgi:hypothetical protein